MTARPRVDRLGFYGNTLDVLLVNILNIVYQHYLRDHGVYMYVVYIWKWSSAHALGGVSGVASFITTDEQLQ